MIRSIIFLLVFSFISCQTTKKTTDKMTTTSKTIDVIAHLSNCDTKEPIGLFRFDGVGFKQLALAETIGKDSFLLKFERSTTPTFYYIGQANQQKMPVIINGQDEEINIKGSCKNIRQKTVIENSPINKKYGEIVKQVSAFGSERAMLGRQFAQSVNNPNAINLAIEKLADLDKRQLDFLDTLKANHPFLSKVAEITTYQSFQNNRGKYQHEIGYFANTYFQFADLKDPAYNETPYLFESVKNYTTVLCTQKLNDKVLKQYLDNALAKIPENNRAYKFALGGMAIALQSKNHPLFVDYGNLFLEKYGQENTPMIENFRKIVKQGSSFIKGAVAPDFTQNTPDGQPLTLSSLRGKVVLIDFWASWCGPCRRENPNVVRMYNRFKDQGFEILGVSLDKKKASWLAAIEKDQLTWLHVSDLKGWKNEVAGMYSVSSVPHTVLLDPKGRIIARNLRGDQLEKKVEDVLNGNY